MIANAASEDDSLAYRTLTEAASHIGAATASITNLLNPEAIIFGGALFRAAPEFLITRIQSVVRHRVIKRSANDVLIQASTLDGSAGARGAARLIANQLIEAIYCSITVDNMTAPQERCDLAREKLTS